jgi:hypothetical protein
VQPGDLLGRWLDTSSDFCWRCLSKNVVFVDGVFQRRRVTAAAAACHQQVHYTCWQPTRLHSCPCPQSARTMTRQSNQSSDQSGKQRASSLP